MTKLQKNNQACGLATGGSTKNVKAKNRSGFTRMNFSKHPDKFTGTRYL